MGKKLSCASVLLLLWAFSSGVFPQEDGRRQTSSVPDILRRPDRAEAPRYPRDIVIGELGRGNSPVGAYNYAKELLSVLISGSRDARILAGTASILTDKLFEDILSLEPRSYRLGSGRIETDGSVSFLIRLLGVEESITGELFLRQNERPEDDDKEPQAATWRLDDLVLEDRRPLTEIRDSYRYDFSPYERFY